MLLQCPALRTLQQTMCAVVAKCCAGVPISLSLGRLVVSGRSSASTGRHVAHVLQQRGRAFPRIFSNSDACVVSKRSFQHPPWLKLQVRCLLLRAERLPSLLWFAGSRRQTSPEPLDPWLDGIAWAGLVLSATAFAVGRWAGSSNSDCTSLTDGLVEALRERWGLDAAHLRALGIVHLSRGRRPDLGVVVS